MAILCVRDPVTGCVVCPALPAVASRPARVATSAVIGWNAAANSVETLDGDMRLAFTMPLGTTGAVLGLKYGRTQPTVPDLISYGFYFFPQAGDAFCVWERGIRRTAAVGRSADDTFEVRRVGVNVTYWHNESLIYTSGLQSAGAMITNTCLYVSGDKVPA